MAMSIPLFLASLIGGTATAYGAGLARRKADEEYEGRKTAQKIMQEAVVKGMFEGHDIPDEVGKQAFGPAWKEMKTFTTFTAGTVRANREKNLQQFQNVAQSFGLGGGGPIVPITPQQAQALPPGAIDPRALPQGGGGSGYMAPTTGPLAQAPPSAGAAMSQIPDPRQVPSGGLPAMPDPMQEGPGMPGQVAPPSPGGPVGVPRRIAPLGAMQTTPSGTFYMDTKGNMHFSVTTPSDEAKRAGIRGGMMQTMRPGVNSLTEVLETSRLLGIEISKDQQDTYGKQDWFAKREEYLDRVTSGLYKKKRVYLSPEVERQAAVTFGAERGYIPAKEIQELWTSPAEMDRDFLRLGMLGDPNNPDDPHQQLRGRTVPEIAAMAIRYGMTPSDAAIKQLYMLKRAQAERMLDTLYPVLQQHPEARLHEIRKRVGPDALTADEAKLADRPADLNPKQIGELRATGRRHPMQREMFGPPVPIPAPPTPGGVPVEVPDLYKPAPVTADAAALQAAGEAREVRTKEEEAAAGRRGGLRGEETVRPELTIPPEKLGSYRNPDTMTAPRAGSKTGAVEAPGSGFSHFLGTNDHANSITRVRKAEAMIEDALKKLEPYMAQGSLATKARLLGLTGMTFHTRLFGTLHLPAGMLPDDKAIKKAFPNETPARGRELAEAAIRLNAMGDEAASILRSAIFDEKGNNAARLVEQQGRALANLGDSALTAAQKFRDFRSAVRGFEETFNVHRTPKYDPKYYLKLGESAAPASGKTIEVWDPATGTVKKVPAP